MTPEEVDYIELLKCIEHEVFLSNPLYANLSLDDAIALLMQEYFKMHDGLKVAEIMRDISGDDMMKMDIIWAESKKTRTDSMFSMFQDALKNSDWVKHEQ